MGRIYRSLAALYRLPNSTGNLDSSRLLSTQAVFPSNGALKSCTPNFYHVMKRYKTYSKSHSANLGNASSTDEDSSSKEDNLEQSEVFDNREFIDMTVEDYKHLYENDMTGNIKNQIETVLKEYEHRKYNSMGRVPTILTIEDMDRCLSEATAPCGRDRFFNYLFKREMIKLGNVIKKERDKQEKAAELEEKYTSISKRYGGSINRTGLCAPNGDLIYGLWHNSLFCRIPENRFKHTTTESKLIDAALYGKKIIFDFDFDGYMTHQAIRSSIEQVQVAYGLNRFAFREVFDLWFCNYDRNSKSATYLEKNCLPNLESSMITIKNDCFTKHFDKSRLVYLTPDSKNSLIDLFNDDIYIIGVFNDKGGANRPISYRKAESMGIRTRSLPIDMHVAWQGGSKSLCINHVLGTLLQYWNNGGNWKEAFSSQVPARKIKPIETVKMEEERRRKKMKRKFNIREDIEF